MYAMGSSPLTRGARESDISVAGTDGLIPADAGSTPTSDQPTYPERAHPR